MRIGVVGGSGFLGAEFIRLLEHHRHAELTMVCGQESAGKDLSIIRPGLAKPLIVEAPSADLIAEKCDAVVLALPHGQSAPLAEELLRRDVVVVDLGSDFRLKNPQDVMDYYGREAPRQKLLDLAWYGLPELMGPPPEGTRLIAAPGCFATALSLTLAPLTPLGLSRVPVFGVTGSSGSGIAPAPGVHHSLRTTGFVAYKALSHQHMGEVSQLLAGRGWKGEIDFVPHSAPVVRGIHLTALVDASAEAVESLFREAYSKSVFVSLYRGPVNMGSVAGSNRAAIGWSGQGDRTAVFCAIDNLVKGGAGQGLQNLNLLMGWPEAEGLNVFGQWP